MSRGFEVKGTFLAASSIKQVISALEHARYNLQHLDAYKSDPESQRPLRTDARITTWEKKAVQRTKDTIMNDQNLIAKGASYSKHLQFSPAMVLITQKFALR